MLIIMTYYIVYNVIISWTKFRYGGNSQSGQLFIKIVSSTDATNQAWCLAFGHMSFLQFLLEETGTTKVSKTQLLLVGQCSPSSELEGALMQDWGPLCPCPAMWWFPPRSRGGKRSVSSTSSTWRSWRILMSKTCLFNGQHWHHGMMSFLVPRLDWWWRLSFGCNHINCSCYPNDCNSNCFCNPCHHYWHKHCAHSNCGINNKCNNHDYDNHCVCWINYDNTVHCNHVNNDHAPQFLQWLHDCILSLFSFNFFEQCFHSLSVLLMWLVLLNCWKMQTSFVTSIRSPLCIPAYFFWHHNGTEKKTVRFFLGHPAKPLCNGSNCPQGMSSTVLDSAWSCVLA